MLETFGVPRQTIVQTTLRGWRQCSNMFSNLDLGACRCAGARHCSGDAGLLRLATEEDACEWFCHSLDDACGWYPAEEKHAERASNLNSNADTVRMEFLSLLTDTSEFLVSAVVWRLILWARTALTAWPVPRVAMTAT